jgi:ERCC4-type nuclease
MLKEASYSKRETERKERAKARRQGWSKKRIALEEAEKEMARQDHEVGKANARHIVERFGSECAVFLLTIENFYRVQEQLKEEIGSNFHVRRGDGDHESLQ